MAEETKNKTGKKSRERYFHGKADARRERKQLEADQRQAKHDSLTTREKITKATKRGGSVRELKRLNARLVVEMEAKAKAKVETPKSANPVKTVKGQKRVSNYRKKVAKN
jgi:hypothetical protein